MDTAANIAAAVWEYPTRTLSPGTAGTPATRAEAIAAAVWTYSSRTATGGEPAGPVITPAISTWVTNSLVAVPDAATATLNLALSTWVVQNLTASLPAGADDIILRSQQGIPLFWLRGGIISEEDLLTDPEVLDFLLGLYAGPLEAVAVTPLSVNVSGTWKEAVAYVRVAGAWKSATISTKVGGVWKN